MSDVITIIFFHKAYQVPKFFNVHLTSEWFSFSDSKEFYKQTGYPGVSLQIYDSEMKIFVPMLTAGGLRVNEDLHPWILVRADGLHDEECLHLDRCTQHILSICDEANSELEVWDAAHSATGGVGAASGSNSAGSSRDGAGVGSADDNEGTRLDGTYQMDIDNDSDDPDYAPGSSDDESDDDVMDTDAEDEEATDTEEEEKRVIIDLTNMSDADGAATDTEEEERRVIIDLTGASVIDLTMIDD